MMETWSLNRDVRLKKKELYKHENVLVCSHFHIHRFKSVNGRLKKMFGWIRLIKQVGFNYLNLYMCLMPFSGRTDFPPTRLFFLLHQNATCYSHSTILQNLLDQEKCDQDERYYLLSGSQASGGKVAGSQTGRSHGSDEKISGFR